MSGQGRGSKSDHHQTTHAPVRAAGKAPAEKLQPTRELQARLLRLPESGSSRTGGRQSSLVLEGNSSGSVARASEKVLTITNEAVKRPNLVDTHFVSLPLAIHPELVDNLFKFQNSVLGSGGSTLTDLGIEKSIFINPKTFHLTVLMLKLWNKDRIEAATRVLQSVLPKVIDSLESRPMYIRLKGLECFGSPAKARVVYAPVEEIGGEDRLLRACHVIIHAFTEAGLVLEKDAKHELKLHATIMNARFRKSNKTSRNADCSFDARTIFSQYGSKEWGEYRIREAHLSQRFVYDDKGYYHCCASIPFPKKKTWLFG